MRESASPEMRKLACPRRLVGAGSERGRSGVGAGPIGTATQRFRKVSWQAQHFGEVGCGFRGRRSTFARPSIDFGAGAALSQGQVPNSWQAQHFRKVKYRFRGRCSTFARSSTDFVAGAALKEREIDR